MADREDSEARREGKRSGDDEEETQEERLLRKAKEYVEKHESRKSHSDEKRSSRRRDNEEHRRGDDHRRDRKHHKEGRSGKNSDDEDQDSAGEPKRRKHRHTSRHDHKDKRRRRDDDDERRRSSRKRSRDDDKEHRGGHSKKKDHRDDHRSNRRCDEKKQKKKEHSKEKARGLVTKKEDLYPLGAIVSKPPEVTLDSETDYFEYHEHLRLFLYREDGAYFEDLTTEKARKAFGRFVDRYNKGALEEAYYDAKGLPEEASEQCKRTRHQWAFHTNPTEKRSLEVVTAGVRKQTEYDADGAALAPPTRASEPSRKKAGDGHAKDEVSHERPAKTPEERIAERLANRRLRDRIQTAEEELNGGRKESRERMNEKRKERAVAIHASSRQKEEAAMGGMELDDSAIYGSGGDMTFQDALAREKRMKARLEEKRQARVNDLQQKEKDKQEAMLKMLGLSGVKPGQKITIAPRKDG